MNLNRFQSIYAYMHHASHKGPVPAPDPYSGNIVFACCLTMFSMAVIGLLMLLSDDFYDWMDDNFLDFFKFMGRRASVFLIVFGLGGTFFFLGKWTIGSKRNYSQLLQRLYEMEESERNTVVSRGLVTAAIMLFSIFVPLLLIGIFALL